MSTPLRTTSYIPEGGIAGHSETASAANVSDAYAEALEGARWFAGGGLEPWNVAARLYAAMRALQPEHFAATRRALGTRAAEQLAAVHPGGAAEAARLRALFGDAERPAVIRERVRRALHAAFLRARETHPALVRPADGLGALPPAARALAAHLVSHASGGGKFPADVRECTARLLLMLAGLVGGEAMPGFDQCALGALMWERKATANARAKRLIRDGFHATLPGMIPDGQRRRLSLVQQGNSARKGGRRAALSPAHLLCN